MSSPVTHHRLFRHWMALPWHIHVGAELVQVVAQAHLVLAQSLFKVRLSSITISQHPSSIKFPFSSPSKPLHISPTSPITPIPTFTSTASATPSPKSACENSRLTASRRTWPTVSWWSFCTFRAPCTKVCTKVPNYGNELLVFLTVFLHVFTPLFLENVGIIYIIIISCCYRLWQKPDTTRPPASH